MTATGSLRRLAFGIRSPRAVFSGPGFAPEAWQRFEPVAHSLVAGYHATLEDSALPALVPRLDAVAPALRGFAYEGAGMALAALDIVAPWHGRLAAFLDGPGRPHRYPVLVGAGLAMARVRQRPEPRVPRLDPLLGWVAVDGYGFHAGFFARRRHVDRQAVPTELGSYARRVFDQGLGRAIWFSEGAVVDRVTAVVGGFPAARHADLWSGVGLASAYGGGADRSGLATVFAAAGAYRPELARGAAVAAWGREQAGNPAAHTELACTTYCGLPAREAAAVADVARADLPDDRLEPAYEIWRRRLRSRFAPTPARP